MISSSQLIGNYTLFTNSLLGGGCFGHIFEGCETNNQASKVAIKRVKLDNLIPSEKKFIDNEKNIYDIISHPNLVKCFDCMTIDNSFYLVLEHCPESLFSFCSKYPKKCVPEREALNIINDISNAMIYLNSKKIIHKNIYPGNILLKDGKVKLCSFVFAQIVEDINEIPGPAIGVGTLLYEAPEILSKESTYSFKCDVWSVGLLLYLMLYGALPYQGKCTAKELCERISKNDVFFPKEPLVSEGTKKLITEILCFNQKERCDWNRIIEITMPGED